MAWRVAYSLGALLAQLNKLAPNRSKLADGSIGDAAHAARTSDHNPWVKLAGLGIVTARDFTHDPKGGLDCNDLAKWLVLSGDKRIKYVIWNRRIWDRRNGWQAYKGINPHDHHLHLSVESTPALYDSTAPWALGSSAPASPITILPVNPPQPVQEDDMTPEQSKMLTDVYNRVMGRDVQRWMTQDSTGYPVIVGPDDPTGWPARSVDIADLLVVGSQLGANMSQLRDVVNAGHQDDATRDAALASAVASLSAQQIASALPAELAKQVVDELTKRLAA